ncbi:MAG: polymer-forming cytoskeletal protein [Pseudomonadota bacterium]
MFRKKDTDDASGTEGVLRRSGSESAQSELPPRKVDLPDSAADAAAEPAASPPPSRQADPGGKRLIVGHGIRLSGEISSCDRLVVEGSVEATLNDTLALEIAESGRFTGGCEVEEADISGVYDGDLKVRKRLFVRATGKLTGTVHYGELELERGGQIAGNISVMTPPSSATAPTTDTSSSIGGGQAAGSGTKL